MKTFKAKDLRSKEGLGKVPDDRPGWYRWWAPEPALKQLLGEYYTELEPVLTHGEGELEEMRYIYVGVAIKESLRKRLNWHINQKHTFSCVKCGALSTLRQSISSLVGSSQGDKKATDELIDLLVVECHPVMLAIRSDQAKIEIGSTEANEMKRHVLPLNLKSNARNEIIRFKAYLTAQRSGAKMKYLEDKGCIKTNAMGGV